MTRVTARLDKNEWWLKYLGKPWRPIPAPPHSFTCGELLRAAYRDGFGLDVPEIIADPLILRDCVTAMTPGRYGLRPLGPDEEPREFDAVFMARVKYDHHVGLGALTGEGLMILHCLEEAGVVLESPADLRGRGFQRLSWYRQTGLARQ